MTPGCVHVPETVYDELERGGVPDEFEELSFERLEPDELQPETTELDPGERAAMAVANERGTVLLTDDLAARDAAVEHSIDVHGSAVVRLRANGVIPAYIGWAVVKDHRASEAVTFDGFDRGFEDRLRLPPERLWRAF